MRMQCKPPFLLMRIFSDIPHKTERKLFSEWSVFFGWIHKSFALIGIPCYIVCIAIKKIYKFP